MIARARLRVSAVLVVAALVAVAPRAWGACHASQNNVHSFDTRLSPVAGRVCRQTLIGVAGGTCGGTPTWQVMLPCDQVSNTAISNTGRLFSILLPRTKSQDLNVLRITWGSEKFALANLHKLTGASPLRGEVRIDFEGDGLRLRADRTVVIPFETVRKTISVVAD
jgi:hypothetical protein